MAEPQVLLKNQRQTVFKKKRIVISKYQQNDIPPPKVKSVCDEATRASLNSKKVDFSWSNPIIELTHPKSHLVEGSMTELPSAVSSKVAFAPMPIASTPEVLLESKSPSRKELKSQQASKKPTAGVSLNVSRKIYPSRKPTKNKMSSKGKSNACMQEGMKLVWMTRGQGVCADESKPIKKFTRSPPKMPRLMLFDFLRIWDSASSFRRNDMLKHFLKTYVSVEPLDLDYCLSHGGTLIFSRFTIGMQITFQRKKSVWMYYQALGVFIKSLQGERFMYEFLMMGGLATAFEVLRVDEMSFRDKTNVFYFLYRLIDGQGGSRVKQFICRDSSSLESVVDCLTMCRNPSVINFARLYLQNLCVGSTLGNLRMIARYVISLLTCDFNPPIQQMACQVLTYVVHQNGETARHCYTHLIDVLRTDFPELLVDVGDLSLSIMATAVADDFLVALNSAAQQTSISEDLAVMSTAQDTYTVVSTPSTPVEGEQRPDPQERRRTPIQDTSLRQQYGALYVLSYMLKNRTELADWMVEKGVIGSLLAAIGTTSYSEVQMSAIRLLLLIHELSPDCAVALAFLLPRKLLVVILEEEESCLAYLTAVMCTSLRRLGRFVQRNWVEWFYHIVLPDTQEMSDEVASLPPLSPELMEITAIKDLLEELIGDSLDMIVDKIQLPIPQADFFSVRSDDKSRRSSRIVLERGAVTPGELRVLQDDDLESFRKYLGQTDTPVENRDEFDEYYVNKYTDDKDYDMGGMEMARLRDAEKALAKYKDQDPHSSAASSTSRVSTYHEESGELEGEGSEGILSATSFKSVSIDNGSAPILQI